MKGLGLRLPDELHSMLVKLADLHDRSLRGEIAYLIKKEFKNEFTDVVTLHLSSHSNEPEADEMEHRRVGMGTQ